jgi:ArsR family transcriptional regulator
MVGDDISTVSRHLAILRDAGVLVERREGNQIFHTVRMKCVLSFFSCVDNALADKDRRRSNE